MSQHSSPFPSCFRPSNNETHKSLPPPPPPPPTSGNPNLTTCLYHTALGLFSLTWSRSLLGRSLHLNLLPRHHHIFDSPPVSSSSSSPSSQYTFHLHIKPLIFWKKHGSKRLNANTQIFWDLTRAKFGSGPEPQSKFYIAVVVDKEITLLVGDSTKEAYAKTKAQRPKSNQVLVLKREHVFANKIYTTRARFGGKTREIQIDCGYNDDTRLSFSVDNKRVLQIKRLKWKFRGNERIEVDGVPVQISWDVYNWLFEKDNDDRHAVFMFRFEGDEDREKEANSSSGEKNGMALWTQQSWSYGLSGIEWRKMRKSLSSSSTSMWSSAGSSGGSSVMEWASTEESELGGPSGFSLLVYAWKR
ncbi:uncharacterized protein LOC115977756 [Quercus lobata]|uniref:DUF868 family protein n=1 Tax=Quercus lobata TaxID=97700 RepID=A0A7N2KU78_QUELO|nr:uncharacterized protein LOC115977756 [Quercus lobata]